MERDFLFWPREKMKREPKNEMLAPHATLFLLVLTCFLRWPTTAIHKYLLYYCILYLSTQTYSLAARVYLPVQ